MNERVAMSADGVTPDNDDRPSAEQVERVDLERRAKLQGWVPKDQYRGDETNWRDAPEFLEYADRVNPILRQNNRHLESQLADLQRQIASQKEELEAMNEVTQDIADRAAKEARKELAAELAKARTDGDTEKEAEILGKLSAPPTPPKAEPKKEEPRIDPRIAEIQAGFNRDHPWFATNMRMAAYCNAALAEIIQTPEGKSMSVQQRLDKAAAETEEMFNEAPARRAPSDVGNSRRGPNRDGAKTWADIPAADQAKALEQGKKLVGPGKTYKTAEDWQKRYTALYFRQDWGTLQGSGQAA